MSVAAFSGARRRARRSADHHRPAARPGVRVPIWRWPPGVRIVLTARSRSLSKRRGTGSFTWCRLGLAACHSCTSSCISSRRRHGAHAARAHGRPSRDSRRPACVAARRRAPVVRLHRVGGHQRLVGLQQLHRRVDDATRGAARENSGDAGVGGLRVVQRFTVDRPDGGLGAGEKRGAHLHRLCAQGQRGRDAAPVHDRAAAITRMSSASTHCGTSASVPTMLAE